MDVYWDDTSRPAGSRRDSPLATREEKRHRRDHNTSANEGDRFQRQSSALHSSRSPTRPSLDSNRSRVSPSRDRRRSEMSRDTKREQQEGRGMYTANYRDDDHQHRGSPRRPWKGKDSVAEFAKGDDTDGRSELDDEEEESDEDFRGGGEDEDEGGENYAEEAEQQLRTLGRLLKQLGTAIEDVQEKKKRGVDALRRHQLTIQKLQQEIDTAISALDLELRCIASSIPSVYRSTLLAQKHQKEQQLASLMRLYEENLLSVNRQDLLAYRAAIEEEHNNFLGVDGEDGGGIGSERTRQTLVQMGDDIQDKTQASLNRTKQLVGETEEIGAQVLSRMNEQTEKLHKANDDLDDVQYNINRAKKTALVIAKNAAGDRFTQCLCLFIVLFLIIAVVLVCVPR